MAHCINVFAHPLPLVLGYICIPYLPACVLSCSDLKWLQAAILQEGLHALCIFLMFFWPLAGWWEAQFSIWKFGKSRSGHECPLISISAALCLFKVERGKVERTLLVMEFKEFWIHGSIPLFQALGSWGSSRTSLRLPVLTCGGNSNNHEFVVGLESIRIVNS